MLRRTVCVRAIGVLAVLAPTLTSAQRPSGPVTIPAANITRVADRAAARFDRVIRDGELADLAPLFAANGAFVDVGGDTVRGPDAIARWVRARSASGSTVRFVRTIGASKTCADGSYESGVFALVRHGGTNTTTELEGVYAVRWRVATADSAAISVMRWASDSAHLNENMIRGECPSIHRAEFRSHRIQLIVSSATHGWIAASVRDIMPISETPTPAVAAPATLTEPKVAVRVRVSGISLELGTTGWSGSGPFVSHTGYFCCGHFFGTSDYRAMPSGREIHLMAMREVSILSVGVGVTILSTKPGYVRTAVSCTTPGYMDLSGGCSPPVGYVDREINTMVIPTVGLSTQLPLPAGFFLDTSVRLRLKTDESYSRLNSGMVDHGMWAFSIGIGRGFF